ncbi:MAG: hypothetical protein R6U02_07600 [Alkalibacterium sp.]
MVTERQLNELEILKYERKQSNESLRIAEVTKILYPVDKKPGYQLTNDDQ